MNIKAMNNLEICTTVFNKVDYVKAILELQKRLAEAESDIMYERGFEDTKDYSAFMKIVEG